MADVVTTLASLPAIEMAGPLASLLAPDRAAALSQVVARYLPERRWYRSKARRPTSVTVVDVIELPCPEAAGLTVVRVEYAQGRPEHYLLVLAVAEMRRADERLRARPQDAMARVTRADGSSAVLYDAAGDPTVSRRLLDLLAEEGRLAGRLGEIRAHATHAFAQLYGARGGTRGDAGGLEPRVLDAEQTNTSIRFGDRLILKLYRSLEDGVTPDLELGLYLTEKARYPHTPAVAGHLELTRSDASPVTLALLQAYVPNEGDAWRSTLDDLSRYLDLLPASIPESMRASARVMGQRTAELHLALAAASDVADMLPEPFDLPELEALHHQMQGHRSQVFQQLREASSRLDPDLPASVGAALHQALDLEAPTTDAIEALRRVQHGGQRIRVHGDYHLGQLLCTGGDFVVIDFEGEPARPLSERRLKRSALADVAGMLRSFQYAAATACLPHATEEGTRWQQPREQAAHRWAHHWERAVAAAFLDRYLEIAASGRFLPPSAEARHTLLQVHLVDKAVYELSYELNHRPTWLHVPVRGLTDLLGG